MQIHIGVFYYRFDYPRLCSSTFYTAPFQNMHTSHSRLSTARRSRTHFTVAASTIVFTGFAARNHKGEPKQRPEQEQDEYSHNDSKAVNLSLGVGDSSDAAIGALDLFGFTERERCRDKHASELEAVARIMIALQSHARLTVQDVPHSRACRWARWLQEEAPCKSWLLSLYQQQLQPQARLPSER